MAIRFHIEESSVWTISESLDLEFTPPYRVL